MKKINFLNLAKKIKSIAEDKKGENIVILDVREYTAITNYFVIITANSAPQTNAISAEIEKIMKYDYELPVIRRDGTSVSDWKVLDFGGILVHIMDCETRQQYNIEQIWQDTEKSVKNTKKQRKINKNLDKKTKNL